MSEKQFKVGQAPRHQEREMVMEAIRKIYRVRRKVDYCTDREMWRFLKTWDVEGKHPFGAYGLQARQNWFKTKAEANTALQADRALEMERARV